MSTASIASKDSNALQWSREDWIILGAILAVTFLCYLPTLGYEFVYDDRLLILKNPAILSWKSATGFFFRDFTSVAIPEAPAVYYRPVLLLWMLVNAKLWGMNPAPWHFTAIALHLIVVVEVYVLARRLLGARFPSAVAAGVFALHPVHVECVAWVMAEAEQITAALVLASLFAYFRARSGSKRRMAWWGVSLGLFVVALLIKENAIMLAALIAAFEWSYFRSGGESGLNVAAESFAGRLWQRVLESLKRAAPHLSVVVLYLVIRLSVLKTLGHVNTPMSVLTFLGTLPMVLYRYLRLLVWPVGLSVCYDIPEVHSPDLQNFVLPFATLLLFIIVLALWVRRKPAGTFAALWMIVPLLPALDLPVFFRSETVHDRYLYLPSVGFCILVGLFFQWAEERAPKPGAQMRWPGTAAVLLLGLLAAGTLYNSRFWRSNWTLFQRAVQIAPHNVVGLNNLGNEYADRGDCEQAINIYRRVLQEYPPYWESAYNAGFCSYKMGRLEEALSYFQHAYSFEPYDPDVCVYFGMTFFKLNRLDEAEPLIRRAISLKPTGRGYHLALGEILAQQGKHAEALHELRAELANYPDEAAAQKAVEEVTRQMNLLPRGQAR